jgi:hypothetical protein
VPIAPTGVLCRAALFENACYPIKISDLLHDPQFAFAHLTAGAQLPRAVWSKGIRP